MFFQIFLFEIKYRLRRPAFYLYFFFIFIFSLISFANGALPLQEKEFINAPGVMILFSSMLSLFLMLVSSAIMGTPLFRDIEYNTREYYLSYPITKAGYFWGRYLGSFLFVLLTGAGIYLGAWLGTTLGPALGWTEARRYGPNPAINYLYPFLTIMLPNIFFTSSLFFGLVAIFRNVKVIYSSGMFLFLGYIIANFFLHNIHNPTVIWLSDPFAINGLRMETGGYSADQLNSSFFPFRGLFLQNRLLWIALGGIGLLFTYLRFSFEKFFSGRQRKPTRQKEERQEKAELPGGQEFPAGQEKNSTTLLPQNFTGNYFRKNLAGLTRIEILNIVRDNYFWIILSGGLIFLSFVFWHGPGRDGVGDFPRTAFFMDVFSNDFIFFIFLIIMFYTGETVHREKLTGYAFINDALPPPTWMLNGAKLLSLCGLAFFLSLTPMLIGIGVQLLRGYTQFNFPLYFTTLFAVSYPKLLEMVFFCYALHIVVNNKFAAHGIGIIIYVIIFLVLNFNYFTYTLFLYSFTPPFALSDMDGIGHMLVPVAWFNGYWLLAGAFLVVTGSLYYARGTASSFKERTNLAVERFRGPTRIGALTLFAAFLAIGGFIYYNVSYLHEYLSPSEKTERAVLAEKQLKQYAGLPLPTVTRMRLETDLYPDGQKAETHAWLTLLNKHDQPVDSLLLDGDHVAEYTFRYNSQDLSYTLPLYYPRGKFNLFRPRKEAGEYRLYRFPQPLMPGDTALVEVYARAGSSGFQNSLYAANLLRNGTIFTGGLPGMGYDEDDELSDNEKRKENGLPEKVPRPIPHNDRQGSHSLSIGNETPLLNLDITVSTAGDQTALAPGTLVKQWKKGGRNYFHYVQDKDITIDKQVTYWPFAMLSGRYAVWKDTVMLEKEDLSGEQIPGKQHFTKRSVAIEIWYDPAHGANVPRLAAAYKEGLHFYSRVFGPSPEKQFRLIEGSVYGPGDASFPNITIFSERFYWNADIREPDKFDYGYYAAAEHLARQWWGFQVAPNNTVGSLVISEGLAKYAAMLMEKKFKEGDRVLRMEKDGYNWGRRNNLFKENDLLHADRYSEWNQKTGVVLYGLQDLIGEDSLNAALREFLSVYAFRKEGPYAGSEDLYRVLQRHVPDSFRYYLTDTWEKVCFYDNKIVAASVSPLKGKDEYKVSLTVRIGKTYADSSGNERTAPVIHDYMAIGLYTVEQEGRGPSHEIYLKKHWFHSGIQTIELIVHGKPDRVAIDPEEMLLDRNMADNQKDL
ncbi:ABC transporter permease/M1 family aminopeptidase [Flavitalea flava]